LPAAAAFSPLGKQELLNLLYHCGHLLFSNWLARKMGATIKPFSYRGYRRFWGQRNVVQWAGKFMRCH
jgi:hypothetical protein